MLFPPLLPLTRRKQIFTMPDMDLKTAYEVLKLDSSATVEDVTRQFRKAALIYHPDRCADKTAAHENFIRLQEACDLVKDNIAKMEKKKTKGAKAPTANKDDPDRQDRSENRKRRPAPSSERPRQGPCSRPSVHSTLTPDQLSWMDRERVPASILDDIRNAAGSSILEIKTWRHFKDWLKAHPPPKIPIQDVYSYQEIHFELVVKTRAQKMGASRSNERPSQAWSRL